MKPVMEIGDGESEVVFRVPFGLVSHVQLVSGERVYLTVAGEVLKVTRLTSRRSSLRVDIQRQLRLWLVDFGENLRNSN